MFNQMINIQSIAKLLFAVCSSILVIFIFLYQYHISIYPFQHEYREGAIASVVSLLNLGQNIYSFENQPQGLYVYGIGYPWISHLVDLVVQNPLLSARIVTSFFIASTSILIVFATKSQGWILSTFAGLFMALIAVQNFNFGFPNAFATFLITLSIVLPYQKKFNPIFILFGLSISMLGFLVKPYVLLACFPLILYVFLFKSVKQSILYGLFCAIFIGFSVFVLNVVFPAYFIDTFILFQCSNLSSVTHMFLQMQDFFKTNNYILIFLLFLIYNKFSKENFQKISFDFKNSISLNLNSGFLKNSISIDYFLFTSIIMLLLFILKLGHHAGTCCGLYLYQIFIPFLIIYMVGQIKQLIGPIFINWVVFSYILYLTISFQSNYIRTYHILKEQAVEIKKSFNELNLRIKIYNSPETASILASNGTLVYNTGQSEYFHDGLNCKNIFSEKIIALDNKSKETINSKLALKEFDLVLLTENYFGYSPVDKTILSSNYQKQKTVYFPMLLGGWQVEFWRMK